MLHPALRAASAALASLAFTVCSVGCPAPPAEGEGEGEEGEGEEGEGEGGEGEGERAPFVVGEPSFGQLSGLVDLGGAFAVVRGELFEIYTRDGADFTLVGSVPLRGTASGASLLVEGDDVLVLSEFCFVVDVSDRAAPRVSEAVECFADTFGRAQRLSADRILSGATVFARDGFADLGQLDVQFGVELLVVGDNLVAEASEPAQIVDHSDLDDPAVVATLGFSVSGWTVDGATLYAVDTGGTLRILDITDPAQPAPRGTLGGAEFAAEVMTARDGLLLGSSVSNFAFDVSDPFAPVQIAEMNDRSNNKITSHVILDDTTFVAVDRIGLAVGDVSSSTITFVDLGGGVDGVALSSDDLVFTSFLLGVRGAPVSATGEVDVGAQFDVFRDHIFAPGGPVAVAGNGAICVEGFVFESARNPGPGAEEFPASFFGASAATANHCIFESDGGLHVVDVSDPSSPQGELVEFDTGFGGRLLARGEDVLFATDDGLTLLNTANPTDTTTIAGRFGRAVLLGDRLVSTGEFGEIEVRALSDLNTIIDTFSTVANEMLAVDDLLFVETFGDDGPEEHVLSRNGADLGRLAPPVSGCVAGVRRGDRYLFACGDRGLITLDRVAR